MLGRLLQTIFIEILHWRSFSSLCRQGYARQQLGRFVLPVHDTLTRQSGMMQANSCQIVRS